MGVLAAQTWFRAGTLIATGDNVPTGFLRPGDTLQASRWIWGTTVTSARGSDYFPALQALPAGFARTLSFLGIGPALAQRAFLTLLFAAVAPAMYLLLRTLFPQPRHRLGAAIGSLFFAFNPTLFFIVPNTVLLINLALLPLLPALVIRGCRSHGWTYPLLLTLASLSLSYAFMNPPSLAIVIVCAAAAFVGSAARGSLRQAAGFAARSVPLLILVNAWWIAPTALTLLGSAGSHLTKGVDPQTWTWTHRRGSIANVLRLTPPWSWPRAEYFPYANTLERGWFVPFAFLPAAITFATPLLSRGRGRRVALLLVASATGLTILAKGIHAPGAGLNRWLFATVPGMWLFREPMAKFTPILAAVFSAGILVALGTIRRQRSRFVFATAAVFATLAITFPLWTGAVIPGTRVGFAPARVRIPQGWTKVAAFINARPGGTLLLPPNDYYQMPYSWFYGADLMADELLTAPVIKLSQLEDNFYIQPDAGSARLLGALRRAVDDETWHEASGLMSRLGVRWIVVRRDINARFPDRRIGDPGEISRAISGQPEFRLTARFSQLDLFELILQPVPQLRAVTQVRVASSSQPDLATVFLPGGAQFVSVDPAIQTPGISRGLSVVLDPSRWRNRERELASNLDVPKGSSGFIRWPTGTVVQVVRRDHEIRLQPIGIELNGRRMSAGPRGISLFIPDAQKVGFLTIDRETVALPPRGDPHPITLSVPSGRHEVTIQLPASQHRTLVDPSFEKGTWGQVGDCNNYDPRSPQALGLRADQVKGATKGTYALALSATAHSACVAQQIQNFDPHALYSISLDVRRARGAPPRICLWQIGPNRCADLTSIAASSAWTHYETTFRPDPGTQDLSLHLYADGAPGGTTTLYDNVRVDTFPRWRTAMYETGDEWFPLGDNLSGRTTATWNARAPLESTLVDPSFEKGTWGQVGDCNNYDPRSPQALGLRADQVKGATKGTYALALSATAHSACVAQQIQNFDPHALYSISLDVRRARGAPPRICLWQIGPNRCADLTSIAASSAWTHYETTFRPDPGTQDLSLHLYADGAPGGTTTLYDNVRVAATKPTPELAFLQRPAPPAIRAPRIEVHRESALSYRVTIKDAQSPFVLDLNEPYDSGWQLSPNSGAHHIPVDGYGNGWIIKRRGSYQLTVTYAPQALVDRARGISVLAWIGIGLALVTSGVRRSPSRLRAVFARHEGRNSVMAPDGRALLPHAPHPQPHATQHRGRNGKSQRSGALPR
jgi:arabinofuranan 3-O-arabinosyltransferase